MTDAMLLQEYARTREPGVLGELVGRHVDWVYSAALRMVGDADLARDVTQAAFLVLVKKASTLEGKAVNAWLFGVTRHAAKHALRERARRIRHERLAAMMIGKAASARNGQPWVECWEEMAPKLEEVVGRLGAAERKAILLRFYQQKSMAEVGEGLGVSEDAAKKRVAKALRRLRELLGGRGVRVPSDLLGVVMLDRVTGRAPGEVKELCVKSGSGAGAAAAAGSIANGVIKMMTMAKIKIAALVVAAVAMVPVAVVAVTPATMEVTPGAAGGATQPVAAVDAADLYGRAAEGTFAVDSPACTSEVFPEFWPSSRRWLQVEAAAFAADAKARELVRQARSADTVNWPPNSEYKYYNYLRNLANHLGDAAVYQDTLGRDGEAVETIRDLNHLAARLSQPVSANVLPPLVGAGVRTLAMDRLEMIASGVVLTNDPQNTRDLQAQAARALIEELLSQPAPVEVMPQNFAGDPAKLMETFKRTWAEQNLAAMSLACHVFKFDQGRWPASLEDLVPLYLPQAIVDPWGDGKQALGYALIKVGLPDGSDRPVVYSRCLSADGLEYPANRVMYGLYIDDGMHHTAAQQKHYGQFRDVTRWEPVKGYTGAADIALPMEMQSRVGTKD
jgi:RNA polymerase sigma factor (sigma-70 family)